MKKEYAIFILQSIDNYLKRQNDYSERDHDAIMMAIEALREMPVEGYRQRLMEVFHRTDHDELLTYVVMPKEEEFKSLEDILRQYRFEPKSHEECRDRLKEVFREYSSINGDMFHLSQIENIIDGEDWL